MYIRATEYNDPVTNNSNNSCDNLDLVIDLAKLNCHMNYSIN